MNVKEIVTKHLKDIGADGLCNDDCDCLNEKIMPCHGLGICVPAKKVKATEPGDCHEIGDEILIPIEEVE